MNGNKRLFKKVQMLGHEEWGTGADCYVFLWGCQTTSNDADDPFSTADLMICGGYIVRVTPVPIPNTEVKPTGADDTASFRCGKVGSRRIYIKKKACAELHGLFLFACRTGKPRRGISKGWVWGRRKKCRRDIREDSRMGSFLLRSEALRSEIWDCKFEICELRSQDWF